ncbi:hypothetical protein [Streptomyces sp. NPDC001068]|uniref:hypothetical protein n=1 Tax=Streptomyces sp. NPDC001068 TaxID=3364544 RepID=UPI0036A43B6D
MAKKNETGRTTDAAREKDREKWLARFQVRLVQQPGVDRAVVLRAVKEVTAHCEDSEEEPRTAFGDPDAHAVRVAARLVPADRAARASRNNAVVDALDSVRKAVGDIAGL